MSPREPEIPSDMPREALETVSNEPVIPFRLFANASAADETCLNEFITSLASPLISMVTEPSAIYVTTLITFPFLFDVFLCLLVSPVYLRQQFGVAFFHRHVLFAVYGILDSVDFAHFLEMFAARPVQLV